MANLSGIYEDEAAFRALLDDFGERITVRLGNEPNVPLRGGRPALSALRHFVAMVADFWANDLGRKFTYSEMEGIPKSDAYDFCREIVHPFASDVTPEQLKTAVRAAVKYLKITVRIDSALARKDA